MIKFNQELKMWFHVHNSQNNWPLRRTDDSSALVCSNCQWSIPMFNAWMTVKRILETRIIRVDCVSKW